MSRLNWGTAGERFYEVGADRGVLYVAGETGVPWNGLISVSESPSGGEPNPYYADGLKYINITSAEEYEASIEAYASPKEFGVCDGTGNIANGLYVGQQPRKSFGLVYRTLIGNDVEGLSHGYKLHIIYNALAGPSERDYTTMSDSSEPVTYSWDITTTPPKVSGYRPTAHYIVDSRTSDPIALGYLEGVLYGGENMAPRLPPASELTGIFAWQASGLDTPINLLGSTGTATEFVENLNTNPSFETGSGTVDVWKNLFTNPSFETAGTVNTEVRRNQAINPSFEASSGTVLVRKNYTPNPTMTGNISSWGANSANWAVSHETVLGRTKAGCVKMVCSTSSSGDVNHFGNRPSASAGQSWTASAYINPATGNATMRMFVDFRDSAGNSIPTGGLVYSEQLLTQNTWNRMSVTATAPTGTASVFARVGFGFGPPVGWTFYVDDVLLENTASLKPYFDGSNLAYTDYTYAWEGTTELSASTQNGVGVANISSMQNGAAVRSVEWSKSGSYSVRTSPWASNTDNTITVAGAPGVSLDGYGVTFVAGKTYTATVVCRLVGPQTGTLHAKARSIQVVYNTVAGWTGVSTVYSNQAPNEAGEYFLTATFTLPSNAVSAGVRLVNGAPDLGGDVWWDNFMLIEGPYSGSYFDGNTPASGDFSYVWNPTPNASQSIQRATSAKSVIGGAAKVIQSKEWSSSGTNSLRIISVYNFTGSAYASIYDYNAPGPMVRGKTYTVFAKYRLDALRPANSISTLAFLNYGTGKTHTSVSVPNVIGVHELRMTITVPDDLQWYLRLYNSGDSSAPDIWVDDLAIIEGTYVGSYFDGNTPANGDYTHIWEGLANDSASLQRAVGVASHVPNGGNTVIYQGSTGAISGTKVARLLLKGDNATGVIISTGNKAVATPLTQYTGFGSIKQDVGPIASRTAQAYLFFYDSAGVLISYFGSSQIAMSNEYVDPRVSATSPEGTAFVRLAVNVYGGKPNDLYTLDSFILTKDNYSTDNPYFDGDTQDIIIYRRQQVFPQWETLAHQSVSEFSFYPSLDREARPYDALTVGSDIWIYTESGYWAFYGPVPGL